VSFVRLRSTLPHIVSTQRAWRDYSTCPTRYSDRSLLFLKSEPDRHAANTKNLDQIRQSKMLREHRTEPSLLRTNRKI